MKKADLMMHPVRIRILLALHCRTLTTRQLAAELSDVAVPTLYHHLGLLTKAGLLQVVEERQIRGTLEKTYALAQDGANLSAEDFAQASQEELMRYFQVFVSGLMGDFERSLEQHETGNYADMGYRQYPLHLSDEEFDDFTQALRTTLQPWRELQPGPGRRRRQFNIIVFPDREMFEEEGASLNSSESARVVAQEEQQKEKDRE